MPGNVTAKFERMFQHVKESEKSRGRSGARAKEIAARTVNQQRRREGKTPNQLTQGTGNPRTRLEARTVRELRNRARELGIAGRSRMNKAELISAVRRRN